MRVVVCQYAGIDAVVGLPLAAGIVVATARREVEAEFGIEVERLPLDDAVARLDAADVVGFSLYPWNKQYALAVTERARAALPEALIVAGGPGVPRAQDSARALLEANPGLDVLVFNEGELAFRELLQAWRDGRDLSTVGGIAFRRGGEVEFSAPPERVRDFSSTGSPYLDGTFDALLARYPGRFAIAICETNRGCPFSCTFCDWSMTKKVTEIPLERVKAEIDWVSRRAFASICFTDANFGIRKRDREIAEHLAACHGEQGRPAFCYFYLTKNNHSANLATIEVFEEAGIDYCVGLAVQDFDDDVLEAVKRDNIQTDETLALREICAERGIRTHNELILGMPRQTYDSFAATVLRAMPGHPRHDFRVYLCRLIDNTELAEAAVRERYGVLTRRCLWEPSDPDFDPIVTELQEIVVGTKDMPIEDWRRTCRFASVAAAAYNQRLLRDVLRFFGERGVDRKAWLEGLCAALEGEGVLGRIGDGLDRLLDSMLAGERMALPLDGLGKTPHELAETVIALAITDPVAFFAEVRACTEVPLEAALVDELFRFQALGTPRFGETQPRTEQFEHDWLTWSEGPVGTPLERGATSVRFEPPSYTQVATPGAFVSVHLACLLAAVSQGTLTHAPQATAAR